MDNQTLQFAPFCTLRDRRIKLHLDIPEERNDVYTFWPSDEDDEQIFDATIEIDVLRFKQTLDAYHQHRHLFDTVTIRILIDSKGFQGKIRGDRLIIMSFGDSAMWTDAEFYNDWSSTRYTFDTDNCWPVERDNLLPYLNHLLQL